MIRSVLFLIVFVVSLVDTRYPVIPVLDGPCFVCELAGTRIEDQRFQYTGNVLGSPTG